MRLITISNLYPRPDKPIMGMFNFQMFREVYAQLEGGGQGAGVRGQGLEGEACRAGSPEKSGYLNICLVPSWKFWQWPSIRRWRMVGSGFRVQGSGDRNETEGSGKAEAVSPTIYLPVFYLPLIGRSINWWFYCRALRSVPVLFSNKSAIFNQQSTISLLASWLYPDAVAVARLAKDLAAPVWLRVHGTDRYHLKNRHRRRLILDAVAYARGVICNCKAVADDLVKWGIPAAKIHIIPNGVDTSLFRVRNKEELLVNGYSLSVTGNTNNQQPITDNSSVSGGTILFVGNLVPNKGPDVLLKAFSLLIKALEDTPHPSPLPQGERVQRHSPQDSVLLPLPSRERVGVRGSSGFDVECSMLNVRCSFSLLIIGSGPMRPQLERLALELGIADRVHFLGNLPHDKVALWMNRADLLCSPSRSEGMPNVVVEALASGLPVVATAVGGTPEVLADEPAARMCQSEDVGALSAGLREVLEMKVDRAALASRYARYYSWNRQAAELLRLMASS